MLLGASGAIQSDGVEVDVVRNDGLAEQSGVPHAGPLIAFADAVVRGEDDAASSARSQLLAELGGAAVVDAAAVVANFQRMNRIADATGIPLDRPMRSLTAELRAQLDIEGFTSAQNTPRTGPLARVMGKVMVPLTLAAMRVRRAIKGRRKRGDAQ